MLFLEGELLGNCALSKDFIQAGTNILVFAATKRLCLFNTGLKMTVHELLIEVILVAIAWALYQIGLLDRPNSVSSTTILEFSFGCVPAQCVS